MNDRLKDIDMTVDNMFPSDYIDILKKKYESDLMDYDYIDTLAKFSLLRLRGSMKYINKYDKQLRSGGLLIKIFQQNGKWIAILKKYDKKYYVSFDANYIFYLNSKQDVLKDWMQYFVSECDKGKYEIE